MHVNRDQGVSYKLPTPQNQYVAMKNESVCMAVGTYVYGLQ